MKCPGGRASTSPVSTVDSSGRISELNRNPFAGLDDVERFDPKGIARREELPIGSVDRDEGIHAVDPMQSFRTPEAQRVGERFGVAPGAEADAERLHFASQLGMIIDFAVERDENAAVGGQHRLGAVVLVDDPQPPRSHRDACSRANDGIADVAAMEQTFDHPSNR